MKLTLPHIVAYAVAGLTTVASLNPVIVTALLGPAGPYAAAGIGLAGALLTFLHDVGVVGGKPAAPTAPPPPATKQGGYARLSLLVVLALAGCATVGGYFKSPDATPVITVAVDLAVGAAESKGVAGADINRIAKLALAADASPSATLATVAAAVNAQVAKLKLPAPDQAAAAILEAALEAAIAGKIDGNADVSAARADVTQVLNAVVAATGG